MAGDGHNRHKRPNRRVCDGGWWAMGIIGSICLIGGWCDGRWCDGGLL